MTQTKQYVVNLDQFERDVMALLTDLRVDESTYEDPAARQGAYIATAKKHGFL